MGDQDLREFQADRHSWCLQTRGMDNGMQRELTEDNARTGRSGCRAEGFLECRPRLSISLGPRPRLDLLNADDSRTLISKLVSKLISKLTRYFRVSRPGDNRDSLRFEKSFRKPIDCAPKTVRSRGHSSNFEAASALLEERVRR